MTNSSDVPTLVIVDDEEIVLKSIDSFLAIETDYKVVTFTSPEDAISYIEKNGVDLIISDYLMPKMDGVVFLSKVRELKPEVPRVILTGYADKENAIKAINEVGLFQYIEKPWDNEDLLIIIRNGLEKRHLQKKLEEKITEISKAYGELRSMYKEILKAFV